MVSLALGGTVHSGLRGEMSWQDVSQSVRHIADVREYRENGCRDAKWYEGRISYVGGGLSKYETKGGSVSGLNSRF